MTPLTIWVSTSQTQDRHPLFSPTTPLAHLAMKRLAQKTDAHSKWISSSLNVEIGAKRLERLSQEELRIEGLALDKINLQEICRRITNCFPTYKDFMEMSLYDKDIGYYSTGKVRFGEGDEDHFDTYPNTLSPGFGKIAVEQAFTMWQAMLAAGDIEPNEPFTILELGAGKGQLAYDMLETAERNPSWKQFYDCLHYCIFEHSPALRALQQLKLAKFVHKVSICKGDARTFGRHFRSSVIKGLVFTNELLDAFSVHNTFVGDRCKLHVQILIPCLTDRALEVLPQYGIDIQHLLHKSHLYQQKFQEILENIPPKALSKQDLKEIIRILDKANVSSQGYIEFNERYVSEKFFPEVKKYRKRHLASIYLLSEMHASILTERHPASILTEELFQSLAPFIHPIDKHPAFDWEWAALGEVDPTQNHPASAIGTELFTLLHPACMNPPELYPKMTVNLGMETFAKNIAKILKKGFMTTIDYGCRDKNWASYSLLRTPRFRPQNKSALTHIAACDITTDVAWTQFLRGCTGFILQFFGDQRSLGDPVPPTDPKAAEWLLEIYFQMLVLKVIGTKASYLPSKNVESEF